MLLIAIYYPIRSGFVGLADSPGVHRESVPLRLLRLRARLRLLTASALLDRRCHRYVCLFVHMLTVIVVQASLGARHSLAIPAVNPWVIIIVLS